ncbi:hypothetical protein [Spirosoma aerophilum]
MATRVKQVTSAFPIGRKMHLQNIRQPFVVWRSGVMRSGADEKTGGLLTITIHYGSATGRVWQALDALSGNTA